MVRELELASAPSFSIARIKKKRNMCQVEGVRIFFENSVIIQSSREIFCEIEAIRNEKIRR